MENKNDEQTILKLIQEAKMKASEQQKWDTKIYTEILDLIQIHIGQTHILTEGQIKNVIRLINKFGPEKVLNSIECSKKYLNLEYDPIPRTANVVKFLDKLKPIILLSDKSELDQRIAYVYGIVANKFGPWAMAQTKIIMKNVEKVSIQQSATEQEFVNYLNTKFIPHLQKAEGWNEWTKSLPKEWLHK